MFHFNRLFQFPYTFEHSQLLLDTVQVSYLSKSKQSSFIIRSSRGHLSKHSASASLAIRSGVEKFLYAHCLGYLIRRLLTVFLFPTAKPIRHPEWRTASSNLTALSPESSLWPWTKCGLVWQSACLWNSNTCWLVACIQKPWCWLNFLLE